MRLRGLLMLIVVAALVAPVPGTAADRTVHLQNCSFAPRTSFVDPGDSVTFSYDEPAASSCFGQSHRIRSSFTPPGEDFDSGQGCDSSESLDPTCLNNGFGRSSWTHTFSRPGTYVFYCPFHGQPSQDGNNCGMCGKIIINPPPIQPPPSTTRPSTAPPSVSHSPSPSASSPSPSPSVSGSPSATPTVTGRKTGGSGGRYAVAFGAVGVLGILGVVVWRALIAQGGS